MALRELTQKEQDLVLQSLRMIEHCHEIQDREFHTRLGITRPALRRVISQWPEIDNGMQGSDEFLAINNCMNEVCNGIRLTPQEWAVWFTESRDVVRQAYENWLRLRGHTTGGIR